MTARTALVQIGGQLYELPVGDSLAGALALGATAGSDLGTAAAGVALTAARSDHVHTSPDLQIDGGAPDSMYGGTTIITGGTP